MRESVIRRGAASRHHGLFNSEQKYAISQPIFARRYDFAQSHSCAIQSFLRRPNGTVLAGRRAEAPTEVLRRVNNGHIVADDAGALRRGLGTMVVRFRHRNGRRHEHGTNRTARGNRGLQASPGVSGSMTANETKSTCALVGRIGVERR
jgi:hypothetical protein